MEITELWLKFKEFFADLVQYGFPTIAIIISIFSFRDSRKASKIQHRLNEFEEKLKKYELEDKEKEREEATNANIEARIMKISKDKYKMKIWNSGKSKAYNADFKVPDECKNMVFRDKVPYEFLEPGKSFEEHIIIYSSF
ncbi:hypothetical protein K1514_12305 [Paraclostridium bifermentans]|uniref:hypothetical protein n=1 Tax=Paraclostridium TaxID=1849822 RepID=UPI001CC7A32F|nr:MULTISPECIES: hypothetical protein [Paraclostridium]MBZ6006673.1 hypothetical protein [Paraclostridium bifermentans]MDU0295639.1 hypothetical protein [Paraclostridium sp. MRS3W1]